jgi:hypothetical protein
MKRAADIINKILFYGFLLFGIILFFFNIDKGYTVIIAFLSFIASWILAWTIERWGLNPKYEIFVNTALWLNLLGEFIFYYGVSEYYDKFLHFSVAILITAIVYHYYLKKLGVKKEMIFFTVLGMLCIWEIYEYVIETFFGIPTLGVLLNGAYVQSPLDDIMIDLICGAIGSLVFLLFKKETDAAEKRRK